MTVDDIKKRIEVLEAQKQARLKEDQSKIDSLQKEVARLQAEMKKISSEFEKFVDRTAGAVEAFQAIALSMEANP